MLNKFAGPSIFTSIWQHHIETGGNLQVQNREIMPGTEQIFIQAFWDGWSNRLRNNMFLYISLSLFLFPLFSLVLYHKYYFNGILFQTFICLDTTNMQINHIWINNLKFLHLNFNRNVGPNTRNNPQEDGVQYKYLSNISGLRKKNISMPLDHPLFRLDWRSIPNAIDHKLSIICVVFRKKLLSVFTCVHTISR